MRKSLYLIIVAVIFVQCSKTESSFFETPTKPLKQYLTANNWEFVEVTHNNSDFTILYSENYFLFNPDGRFIWARYLTCGLACTYTEYRFDEKEMLLTIPDMDEVDLPGPIGENFNYIEITVIKVNSEEMILYTLTDEQKETWFKLKKSEFEYDWQ